MTSRVLRLVSLTILAFTVVTATSAAQASRPTEVGRDSGKVLIPQKAPFYPNDVFGNYEPTITADGNTIYFARFSTVGDTSVYGNTTDLFVTHRIRKSGGSHENSENGRRFGSAQSDGWLGSGDEWSKPQRLPDTVNSPDTDQEPQISADGKTLHWMSMRPGGYGDGDIYVSHKRRDGSWTQAENMGPTINTPYMDHCFIPYDVPGKGTSSINVSIRPRTPGGQPTADFYTTKAVADGWQTPTRLESALLDSIDNKCRLTTVTKYGMVLGVLTLHKFGQDHGQDIPGTYHKQLFIRYDRKTRQWVGPVVEAPYNVEGVDGACPLFSPDGTKMIWSAGYDRGPGPISQASGQGGSVYDLFSLSTKDIVNYYRAEAGLR